MRLGDVAGMNAKRNALSTLAAAAALSLAVGVQAAGAAPGALDPGFGDGGILLSEPGSVQVYGLAVQPDGKVLALDSGFDPTGYERVQRFLPSGSPDPSFGNGGVAQPLPLPGYWMHDMALQPDGKIVLAGYDSNSDFAVARLMPDGKLDPDFDGDSGTGNGVVHTPVTPSSDMAKAVAVDKQGRIVVAGGAAKDVAVARYLPNGKLDKTFSGDGYIVDLTPNVPDEAWAVAAEDDGVIVAGESMKDSLVARYDEQGVVDQDFGKYGRRVIDTGAYSEYAGSLGVQSDGTLVLAISTNNPSYPAPQDHIIGLTPGGADDPSFGNAGDAAFDETINALAVAPDDKVAFAGGTVVDGNTVFAVRRLNADGSSDAGFAGGGSVLTGFHPGDSAYAQRVALAPDGKVVAGGLTYNSQIADNEVALTRYLVDRDPPAAGAPADGTAPAGGSVQPGPLALSGLKLTNRTFAVARGSTPVAGRAHAARKRGTAFVFTLNRAGTVTIRVKRLRGRAKVVKLVRSSGAGRNRVRFTGRIRRHALRPGLYRATLRATDAAGGRSTSRAVRFRIVR